MKHLPAIDGLRAIAVLAVVAYHAGLPVPGGFVGVDVFFVISGYLITSLLLREQAEGRIDLLAFYARRVRRIFPAAAVVVLATLGAASLLLDPTALTHAANSAGAALVFGANVFFQLTTGGYWDARSEEMPLLHLWSLSVEEQFYLVWPALLLISIPKAKLRPTLIGLALVSLAIYVALPAQAAFYQMPARFWELCAGGLVATLPARPMPRGTAWVGLGAILLACAFSLGHFPGLGVAGAALVVLAVHGGGSNALLASRPMVGIGLISYSLYLWHWPLLALYRATSIGGGRLSVKLALCGVAVLLAIASYRYVEQPFRRMRFRSGRTVATGAALSSVIALSACAVGLHVQQVQAAHADNPAAVAAERDMASKACHISGADAESVIKCQPHSRVLVWGDSMAWSWLPSVPDGSDVSMDACPPFLSYLPENPAPGDRQCLKHNSAVAGLPADKVVLAARWRVATVAALEPTLKALRSVPRVVVIGPSPEVRDLVPRCIRQHAEAACTLRRAEFDATAEPILAALHRMAAKYPNVQVVDVSDRFCTATACPPLMNGAPLYWDTHHITASAARSMSGRW